MVTKKETPEVDPWEDGTTARRVFVEDLPQAMADRDRLTITLKAGSGYDAPWLVYHAASVDEGIDFLTHDRYDELADLTARKGKELAKAFGGPVAAAKPAASSGGWGGKQKAAPSGSFDEPSDSCPTHNCELVKVDAYTKRDGTDVSARYACPVPNCYKKTYWQQKNGSWELKEK